MTSLLPFYLCLIWQWVILVNFIAYGLIEFSTKCTSLFGQSLHNQASTYAYFNCYCYWDPGIKGSVCACWGSFSRVGFHFMSMLYISFHDSCWCWMKLLWFVLTHQLGVHVRGIHLHPLHPLYVEVSNKYLKLRYLFQIFPLCETLSVRSLQHGKISTSPASEKA